MLDTPLEAFSIALRVWKTRRDRLFRFSPMEIQFSITLPGIELANFANIELSHLSCLQIVIRNRIVYGQTTPNFLVFAFN